jgi:hypothetical protein
MLFLVVYFFLRMSAPTIATATIMAIIPAMKYVAKSLIVTPAATVGAVVGDVVADACDIVAKVVAVE